jgi:hypothetical protein
MTDFDDIKKQTALGCLAAFLALPVTALLCRHCVTRGKMISYGTAAAGAYIADLLVLSFALVCVACFEIWAFEYWTAIFIGYGLLGLFAVLPASVLSDIISEGQKTMSHPWPNKSPLPLSVPLSRFTPRVGDGSAFYVRPL